MTEAHNAEHHGPTVKAYMIVFGALSIFTLVSFLVNSGVRGGSLTPHAGFALILGVAVVKAVLVGTYFMHLIVDWSKLYYFIFPTFILGAMMVVVFLPDIVLGWNPKGHVPSPPVGNAADPVPHD
jgi:heme/copper-type cytochrome/quinol oxidase subunit 4